MSATHSLNVEQPMKWLMATPSEPVKRVVPSGITPLPVCVHAQKRMLGWERRCERLDSQAAS